MFCVAFPSETCRMVEPNCSVLSVSASSFVSGLTLTNTQHCRGTRGHEREGLCVNNQFLIDQEAVKSQRSVSSPKLTQPATQQYEARQVQELT